MHTRLTPPKDDLRAMEALLRRLPQLHTAPQVAQRVLQLTGDPGFDVGEVVSCLESDPALAARVLRVVNSPAFGLARKVQSLRQAVARLGQRSLRLVAMTFNVVDALTRGAAGRLYHDYWRRALTMAAAAARLAEHDRDLDRDAAYSGGLLAEVGTLALAQADGDRYAPLCARVPHGPELLAAERQAFGFTHAALGALLLARWEFPAPLFQATLHHHDDRPEAGPVERAVQAAALLAEVLWAPRSAQLPAVRRLLEEDYGLDMDGFIGLAVGCKQDVDLSAELFNVRLAGTIDCHALLDQARQRHAEAALETALELDSLLAVFEDHSA
ncbi:MAG TPA: HDOD domain-containing protein [Gemmataceae bacterium]|nr:HDOD domain-containing protein [Gemmataceae bacterium]